MPGALYTGVEAGFNKPCISVWYCWLRKSASILPVHYFLRGNLKMTVNYG